MICGASVVSMVVSSATLHNLILGHCRILLAQVGQWLPRPSWKLFDVAGVQQERVTLGAPFEDSGRELCESFVGET